VPDEPMNAWDRFMRWTVWSSRDTMDAGVGWLRGWRYMRRWVRGETIQIEDVKPPWDEPPDP